MWTLAALGPAITIAVAAWVTGTAGMQYTAAVVIGTTTTSPADAA